VLTAVLFLDCLDSVAASIVDDRRDLRDVSIASDHLVQHRVDEEAQEKARDRGSSV
jgi:hypothetical protein